MVFIFHCFTLNREIWGSFQNNSVFQGISKIAQKGHHGVGLFFVLSGFLITFLLLNEVSRNGSINVRHFFMRRILRIWPLYFLLIIFGFFIFPHLPYGKETIHSLLNYSTFLSNFDEIYVGHLDNLNFLTVTWSVSIEEQFYLSWMLLMVLLPFFRKGKFFQIYFVILILISIVFRFFHQGEERTLYFSTFAVMSDLAIGGLLAFSVRKYAIGNLVLNMNKRIVFLIYLIGIGILLFSNKLFPGFLVSIERLAIALFFVFVILEQVYAKNSFYKIDKVPGFFFSGGLTYGFYMFHCIYIYYWAIFFNDHGYTEHLWQFVLYILVIFCSTYFTAYLSLICFERPILGLKKYFR